MDIEACKNDIALAQTALHQSKLFAAVQNRPLIGDVYCLPSHQHQSFYLQIFGGEDFLLLYAKPFISTFWGQHIVMYSFTASMQADQHPARKGVICCGIKHLPVGSSYITTLLGCLPLQDEYAASDKFIIDGNLTVIRNHQTPASRTLLYHDAADITCNSYSPEQKVFLDHLYLHTEDLLGNLLDSCNCRSSHDWF